jgi:acetoin utilization deacetylase AcuC-like enzyme
MDDMGARAGEGFSINLPVPKYAGEDTWVSLVEHIAIPAAEEFRPQLILVSAGFDGHHEDPQGNCLLDEAAYAEMARHVRALGERVGAPVGAVLEGGYALDALAASVCATMEALAGDEPPDSVAPDHVTSRAASHIGHHWTL